MTVDSMASAGQMLEEMTRRELTDVCCILLGRLSYLKDLSPEQLIIDAQESLAVIMGDK